MKIEVIETPFLFDVKFRDLDHGMITGLGGVALTSSDGGRNWEYLQTGSKQALFAAAFADSKLIAVGEKGLRRSQSRRRSDRGRSSATRAATGASRRRSTATSAT